MAVSAGMEGFTVQGRIWFAAFSKRSGRPPTHHFNALNSYKNNFYIIVNISCPYVFAQSKADLSASH
jgi:hypothetical protein